MVFQVCFDDFTPPTQKKKKKIVSSVATNSQIYGI